MSYQVTMYTPCPTMWLVHLPTFRWFLMGFHVGIIYEKSHGFRMGVLPSIYIYIHTQKRPAPCGIFLQGARDLGRFLPASFEWTGSRCHLRRFQCRGKFVQNFRPRKKLTLPWSTIRTLLYGKINPKDWQVLLLGDVGFLLFFRVVSGDYGKPWLPIGSIYDMLYLSTFIIEMNYKRK